MTFTEKQKQELLGLASIAVQDKTDILQVMRRLSVPHGLDADKRSSPIAGDIYAATDTTILYVCYVTGTWSNAGSLYLLLAGGTMSGNIVMDGNDVTGAGTISATDRLIIPVGTDKFD